MNTKRFNINILSSLIISISLYSCNSNNITNNEIKSKNKISDSKIIRGNVEFPQNFKIKATINDISTSGTVSLIYPHDHATNANKTIATGLTDSSGNFVINLLDSFNPSNGEIFVLEVTKRIGRVSNKILSLRTFIRFNGINWESITQPRISINSKTTALCLISSYQRTPPVQMIKLIDNSSGIPISGEINNLGYTSTKVAFTQNNTLFIGDLDGNNTSLNITTNTTGTIPSNFNFSSDGGRIVSTATNNVTVFKVDGSSSVNIPILSGTTVHQDPSFSPDDKKVLFSSSGAIVSNADGTGTALNVSGINVIYPTWADNGNKVVYLATQSGLQKLFSAPSNASSSPIVISGTLTSNVVSNPPAISNDGKKVAFISNNSLYIANVDGSSLIQIPKGTLVINQIRDVLSYNTAFSPDDKKIVFLAGGEIYVSNTDGTGLPVKISNVIPNTSNTNLRPQWTPDGNKIVFKANQGTGSNGSDGRIYIANADGTGNQIDLSNGLTNCDRHRITEDGKNVIYEAVGTTTTSKRIFISNIDVTGNPIDLFPSSVTASRLSTMVNKVSLNVTKSKIDSVETLVNNVLTSNYDPFRFVEFNKSNYSYFTSNP